MKRELKFSVCNSSAKTFAMQMTKTDTILSIALAFAAGGLAYVWGDETSLANRVLLALLAATSAYSSYVIVRVLVPFMLRLSFANMMRLRLPFYLWSASLVVTAGLCGVSQLFAAVSPSSIQLTLTLASIALTVRFFQRGSLFRLAAAFSCAGGALGISALGVVAPALTLFLLWFLADRVLSVLNALNFTCWNDKPHPDVIEYFTNPLVRSRVKWMFVGCFLLCAGLAFRLVMRDAGGLSNAGHVWLGCIGLDGAAFLLMTAILPLVVGLGKAGEASDVIERSDFGSMLVYMVIAPLTALFMLKPGLIPSLAKLDLHIEPNVLALASVVYVFNLLLAGVIILADIRCRDFRGVDGVRADNLRNVMRFSYTVVGLAPLVLVGSAIFLSLK